MPIHEMTLKTVKLSHEYRKLGSSNFVCKMFDKLSKLTWIHKTKSEDSYNNKNDNHENAYF